MSSLKDQLDKYPSQFEKLKILNKKDKHQRTALFYAIYYNNYQMVNFILSSGAETLFSDDIDRTVLHYACIIGVSKAILHLILDFNTRLDQQNSHTAEANRQYKERKANKYDMPVRKVRQARPSILHTSTKLVEGFGLNIESIRAGKLSMNG